MRRNKIQAEIKMEKKSNVRVILSL